MDRLVSRSSRETALSGSPSWSLQPWNFSRIQAASPAGESSSPYPRVWGFVPWIYW